MSKTNKLDKLLNIINETQSKISTLLTNKPSLTQHDQAEKLSIKEITEQISQQKAIKTSG
jgi:hypothetical protein